MSAVLPQAGSVESLSSVWQKGRSPAVHVICGPTDASAESRITSAECPLISACVGKFRFVWNGRHLKLTFGMIDSCICIHWENATSWLPCSGVQRPINSTINHPCHKTCQITHDYKMSLNFDRHKYVWLFFIHSHRKSRNIISDNVLTNSLRHLRKGICWQIAVANHRMHMLRISGLVITALFWNHQDSVSHKLFMLSNKWRG